MKLNVRLHITSSLLQDEFEEWELYNDQPSREG